MISKFDLNVEVYQKDIFTEKNLSTDIIVARAFKPLPIILDLIKNNFKFFKEVILFLGKSGRKIVEQVSLEWNIQYETKKSITNKDSLILKITNLEKK